MVSNIKYRIGEIKRNYQTIEYRIKPSIYQTIGYQTQNKPSIANLCNQSMGGPWQGLSIDISLDPLFCGRTIPLTACIAWLPITVFGALTAYLITGFSGKKSKQFTFNTLYILCMCTAKLLSSRDTFLHFMYEGKKLRKMKKHGRKCNQKPNS